MRIAIIAGSYARAAELKEKYGLTRSREDVRVFTQREMLMGIDFSGWLVITSDFATLVPVHGNIGREFRYQILESYL